LTSDAANDSKNRVSFMRCLRCKGSVLASGSDPTRHTCEDCGQNYRMVLRLEPVDPPRPDTLPLLPESESAG